MNYHIFVWKYFLFQFQQHIEHWAKPATLSFIRIGIGKLIVNRCQTRMTAYSTCLVTIWDAKYRSLSVPFGKMNP
jgi:hypothetical protein